MTLTYWEISDSESRITSLAEIHFLTPIPAIPDPRFRIPDSVTLTYWEISDSESGITSLAEIHFLTPIPDPRFRIPSTPSGKGEQAEGKGATGRDEAERKGTREG